MAVKYFCDVCRKEISTGKVIRLLHFEIKIRALCFNCWKKAEKFLKSLDPSLRSG